MQQPSSRAGASILGVAFIVGIAADILLRAGPWGINVALFTLILCAATPLLARRYAISFNGGGRWAVIPAVAFALIWAWRDASPVLAYSLLALLVLLALYAWRGCSGRLALGAINDYVVGIFAAGLYAAFGIFPLLFSHIAWRDLRQDLRMGRVAGGMAHIAAGALIALPLLAVFGLLFAAADPNFETLMRDLVHWNFEELIGHIFLIGFFTWLVAGYLHMQLTAKPVVNGLVTLPSNRMGIVEIGTVLGLLNVMFAAFVILQFRYLFGGVTAVGYAEYARRGFFELVTVAALVLPMLLLADWLVRKDHPAQVRVFNLLAGGLVVLLCIIMLSAVQRMALYVDQYGLTELRVYTTAFMAWLALVFGWLVLTVLRNHRERFVFGALCAAVGVGLILATLNPDYFIARTNVDRLARQPSVATTPAQPAGRDRPLDAAYLTTLGADALPVLFEALPGMPEAQRCNAARIILQRWDAPNPPDWRTWNVARYQAWQLVQANHASLQQMACPLRPGGRD